MTPAAPFDPAAWRSLAEWRRDAARIGRDEAEAIAALDASETLGGECALCGSRAGFRYAGASRNLREGLQCRRCACNARQRAAAMVLFASLPDAAHARVYATEQASPLFVALRGRLPRLKGSEFATAPRQRLRLSLWLWRQGVRGWVASQDVTALRHRDARLDAVITLDVLEHVPEFEAALREFARVLRPGGSLVLTVPFYDDRDDIATIARVAADGRVEHVGAPEFHGDPLSGVVVCFHHFGWRLIEALRSAGFADACACRVQSVAAGLPGGQWVLRAVR